MNTIIDAYAQTHTLRAITLKQKRMVLTQILRDLAERDLDLANVTTDHLLAYRQYWASLVASGTYTTTYAAHVVKQWNAAITFLFGDEAKALLMRGFPQRARRVEHLTEDDFANLLRAVAGARFSCQHDRVLFSTYILIASCTGARIGSLLHGHVRALDVNVAERLLALRHMKMGRPHVALLSSEATAALSKWIAYLETTQLWHGPATSLFVHDDGAFVQSQWVNRHLKRVATAAGIQKQVTTHAFRKAVATIMGRENRRLAREQLAVSDAVLDNHYDIPTLDDRQRRRDLLPRIGKAPSQAETP